MNILNRVRSLNDWVVIEVFRAALKTDPWAGPWGTDLADNSWWCTQRNIIHCTSYYTDLWLAKAIEETRFKKKELSLYKFTLLVEKEWLKDKWIIRLCDKGHLNDGIDGIIQLLRCKKFNTRDDHITISRKWIKRRLLKIEDITPNIYPWIE